MALLLLLCCVHCVCCVNAAIVIIIVVVACGVTVSAIAVVRIINIDIVSVDWLCKPVVTRAP